MLEGCFLFAIVPHLWYAFAKALYRITCVLPTSGPRSHRFGISVSLKHN